MPESDTKLLPRGSSLEYGATLAPGTTCDNGDNHRNGILQTRERKEDAARFPKLNFCETIRMKGGYK